MRSGSAAMLVRRITSKSPMYVSLGRGGDNSRRRVAGARHTMTSGMSAQHPGPGGPPPAADAAVVGVLGVIAIRRDDSLRALPGARARLLLTALAVRPGRARSAQALVEEVWGEQPPRAPMNAL